MTFCWGWVRGVRSREEVKDDIARSPKRTRSAYLDTQPGGIFGSSFAATFTPGSSAPDRRLSVAKTSPELWRSSPRPVFGCARPLMSNSGQGQHPRVPASRLRETSLAGSPAPNAAWPPPTAGALLLLARPLNSGTPLPPSAPSHGFGGSLRPVVPLQRSTDALAYIEHFRSVRPEAAPAVVPDPAFTPRPSSVALLDDSLLSPSSHTRTLDEKRLAAAKSATELDAGAKMRDLTLRAQRAVAVDSATSSRRLEIEAAQAALQSLSLSRPTLVMEVKKVDTGLTDLTVKQAEMYSSALACGNAKEILAQGAFIGFGDLEVTRANMECMHDGRWLNDEVINFYLALLLHRELQVDGHRPRVHFHSTFFYNKLFADQNEYNFKLVSRWTTEKRLGYKLLECDLVVVPVHQAMHWVLAVIDIKQREITYLDSLGGVDRNCLRNLARYICDEAQHKQSEAWACESWSVSAPKDIPQQLNGCDCGVFMVKYADWLARQARLTFSQSDMPYFRRRMVAEIIQVQPGPL